MLGEGKGNTANSLRVQKRMNRFFLDNKQLPCLLTCMALVTLALIGLYLFAAQRKEVYNENLEIMFSEILSLKDLLDEEQQANQLLASEFSQITSALQARQRELEKQQQTIRSNEALIKDLEYGMNTLGVIPQAPIPSLPNVPTSSIPIPILSVPSSVTTQDPITIQRREAVKEAFTFAWDSYKNYAWGKDEVKPKSKGHTNWLDLAVTMVDALDTLWIMDMKDEFKLARDWIAENLNFDKNRDSSLFETTIRELGGLLSAYDLSKDKMFLEKAEDLGKRLLKGFVDESGLPHAAINLATGRATSPNWIRNLSILSEVGTLQLEFLYLAYHTNNPEYAIKPLDVFRLLDSLEKEDGLYPLYLNRVQGTFSGNEISFGALGDSFYEYLLKLWIFTGKEADGYRRMYEESANGGIKRLLKTSPSGFRYLSQITKSGPASKMEHLTCFAGGMYALGAQSGAISKVDEHKSVGADVTASCHQAYKSTATGIGPETFEFKGTSEFIVPGRSSYYILRPETVESYFVLWRTTKDPKYREWAWEAFQAIQKHCRVEGGFSGIQHVDRVPVTHDDTQQSFFLAETLKYLYLIFSDDDLIPLDQYVFNTEAHPLSIPKESIATWPQELQFRLIME